MMRSHPALRRCLAAAGTLVLLAGVLAYARYAPQTPEVGTAEGETGHKGPATDWPLFGGNVNRNMVNLVEKGVPTEWSIEKGSEKNIKWVADLGSKAYGGPVVADGKVFIGTNNENPRNPRDVDAQKKPIDKGVLMCFDEKTGNFLWQAVHDKLEAGRVQDWPREGICSTPFVEGKRIYYVNNRCQLVCADTEGFLDGKNDGVTDEEYKDKTDVDIIWRLDMIKELGVFPHNLSTSSPLVVGDSVFIVTSNGVDEGHINIPKPQAPSFLAVNKNTGKVIWSDNRPSRLLAEAQQAGKAVDVKSLVNEGKLLMHGQWSSPVYAVAKGRPQILFPGGDGWIYSFNPANGDLLWKFQCNPKQSKYELGGRGTRSDFIATPVVYDDKLYIGVGQDPEHDEGVGHFWCIDITKTPANDDKDLSPPDNTFDPEVAANKSSGLVWHYGGLAKGGARNYVFGRTMSTAAVHDGLCYIAELAGYVHCLDAKTGKKYWDHYLEAATWSSPYWVDGKIYMGNDDGKVVIFAHGKEKKIVGEMDMETKVRAMPVAANGTLYITTENKLYAIASGAGGKKGP